MWNLYFQQIEYPNNGNGNRSVKSIFKKEKKRVEKSYVFQEKKFINKNNIIGCEVLRNEDKKRWKKYISDKLTFVGTLAISKYILTGVKTYMEMVRMILRNECVFVQKSHKWRSSNRQNGNNCSTRPESISKTKKIVNTHQNQWIIPYSYIKPLFMVWPCVFVIHFFCFLFKTDTII